MSDIHYAQLDWDEHSQPLSRHYADIYFSRASGLAETRHVFLDGNRLAERFTTLPAGGRLVIGETGFGTGLNFLCAWQLFQRTAPADCRLQMISAEKHPLSPDDLQRALSLWPELKPLSEQLLARYQVIHPGFQHFQFADGRVTLTLLIGDVHGCLPQLDGQVDAWFLDGFSPAKNPQMWTPTLFAELARLSAPGATLATFTSAGFVRRGLAEAGFVMTKSSGFGHKREMLTGHYSAAQPRPEAPWFARPAFTPASRQAIVIGAGLAGCATAASLAARGWQVQVLERHALPAQEGSGNPQGVLYLKLSAHHTALSRLIVSGFGYTRRLLERLPKGEDWDDCGVLQLAYNDKERRRQQQLAQAFSSSGLLQAVNAGQAGALAGIALDNGGLFYPEAGWLHPPALCRALLDHPAIELHGSRSVQALSRQDSLWHVVCADGQRFSAPVIVLANAAEVCQLDITAGLPLKRIRGQITRLPGTSDTALRTVLCAEGYITPERHHQYTLGASFDFHGQEAVTSVTEHLENLQRLREISSDLQQRLETVMPEPERLQGRASFRCTSPDYLPLIGPLADARIFAERYAILGKDARQQPDSSCPWHPGLYLNTGHGSRGLITAPLAAELLCAWLENEPLPVARDIALACHPNRFMLRQLIRGQG